jgi:hypothetical protein
LILLVGHTRSEMGDTARIGLFGPSQIGLRNEDETHRQHSKTTELFGRIKDGGRESRRHFTVETNFDSGLDLVLGFDKRVEEFVGVYDSLPVVGHETDECSIPFVAVWLALSMYSMVMIEVAKEVGAADGTHMILLNVADPDDIRTCLILLLKSWIP